MSPPVPPGEREPFPEHWGFVQGGRAEWRVCAAGAARQGGKASRLPHLFTWKRRSWPGPASAAAATFMLELTGWGVPRCAHPQAAHGITAMGMQAGTWHAFSYHDAPTQCWTFLPAADRQPEPRDACENRDRPRGG